MRWVCLIAMITLGLIACTSSESDSKDSLIGREVERKVDRYFMEQREACISNTILDAEIFIDSVFYNLSGFNVLDDSIQMILRPNTPNRPDYLEVKDTSAIVPYLDTKDSITLN